MLTILHAALSVLFILMTVIVGGFVSVVVVSVYLEIRDMLARKTKDKEGN